MEVTLLFFDDCPNWRCADEHLRQIAKEIPGIVINRQRVETAEQADTLGFRGSPSILIDGADPFADADAPTGLSCRMYPTPTGVAGAPTLDQLRAAFADA